MDFSSSLVIDFDNKSDSEATVVTLTGPDQHNLLLRITGALNSLGLNVKSASISVGPDNTVFDVFRVVGSDNKKVCCRVLSSCTARSKCACTYCLDLSYGKAQRGSVMSVLLRHLGRAGCWTVHLTFVLLYW